MQDKLNTSVQKLVCYDLKRQIEGRQCITNNIKGVQLANSTRQMQVFSYIDKLLKESVRELIVFLSTSRPLEKPSTKLSHHLANYKLIKSFTKGSGTPPIHKQIM